MNKSVLRTAIVVIICMLAFEYILKFFFPEEFVLVVSSPNLIKIGTYINNHLILNILISSIISFISYYIFTCATSKNKYLNIKVTILIGVLAVLSNITTYINYNFTTPFLVSSMILMSCVAKSDMKTFSIVFIVHTIAQVLSLEIRNLSTYIVSYDIITCTLLGIESYLWMLLFYFLNCFNIKEREVK